MNPIMKNLTNLTDEEYWAERQSSWSPNKYNFRNILSRAEWYAKMEPWLRMYEGQRFLELGCSPGIVSAGICSHISFQAEGVDFSPKSHLYLKSLEIVGIKNAKLHICDFRNFFPNDTYDVVLSAG